MIVMKFGGTSVGTAERIQSVAEIIKQHNRSEPVVVVVSAMSQVTNLLVQLAENTVTESHAQLTTDLAKVRQIHLEAVQALGLTTPAAAVLEALVTRKMERLENIIHSLHALGELTDRGHDLVVSFGERLNAQLVAKALEQISVPAEPLEAQELIVTDGNFGNAQPLLAASRKRMKAKLDQLLDTGVTPVITGFIGGTAEKIVTTLGRGGSDYSATILGNCLGAREVWIWTDVDGVMTADPRIVEDAANIKELTYDEAAELSYFGAKVLHSRTMIPAALKDTPIWIKNTLNVSALGTKIWRGADTTQSGVKAITVMKDLSLITVQGKGMSGVTGFAAKIFTTIAAERINVLFISQASSQNNITFLIKTDDGSKAMLSLKQLLKADLAIKNLEMIQEEDDLAIVAVVGEGMRRHLGIAGQVFSALGEASINIRAIAQGSSELNISLVVQAEDATRAVQSIHDKLRLGRTPRRAREVQ